MAFYWYIRNKKSSPYGVIVTVIKPSPYGAIMGGSQTTLRDSKDAMWARVTSGVAAIPEFHELEEKIRNRLTLADWLAWVDSDVRNRERVIWMLDEAVWRMKRFIIDYDQFEYLQDGEIFINLEAHKSPLFYVAACHWFTYNKVTRGETTLYEPGVVSKQRYYFVLSQVPDPNQARIIASCIPDAFLIPKLNIISGPLLFSRHLPWMIEMYSKGVKIDYILSQSRHFFSNK